MKNIIALSIRLIAAFSLIFIINLEYATAQEPTDDKKIYLPFLVAPPRSTPLTGSEIILRSADLFMEEPYENQIGDPTSSTTPISDGPVESVTCTLQNWGKSEVRELVDTVAVNADTDTIYPGALIQGKGFQDGQFTPITIPRSGGTVFMSGLKLAPNAKYTRTLNEVTGANVKQAIEDILSAEVTGTAAEASYTAEQTHSFEHMLFSLGVDARYGNFTMEADLSIDTQESKNYIFLKFVQKYYDVVYEHPETATSVFRDGVAFADPENQIGLDNPPLYVSRVSYGRMVFFVAESTFSASDVQAALEGAYNGGLASVEVESGYSRQEVMANTKIHYYVRGGDAGLALQPIDSASPNEMYDKVKEFLGDKEAANYSASSPGVPIAYTLRYLKNRETARMSYNINYNAKDCSPSFVQPERQFTLRINKLDDDLWIEMNGEFHKLVDKSEIVGTYLDVPLNPWMFIDLPLPWPFPPGTTTSDNALNMWLGNYGCFGAEVDFDILRDGKSIHHNAWHSGGWSHCGWQVEFRYRLNPKTGDWQWLGEF